MKTEMYCYLEDKTKKELPETEVFERWLDPAKTAIACIDMHRGHVGPEDELSLPVPRARVKIPAHNLFQRLARQIGVPVIHVQHWQRHGGIDDALSNARNAGANWRHLYELYLPPNRHMLEHSWEGTKWLDLMVEEEPGDYYIRTKKRLSAFYPTDFEFLLRQLDVENVVLTGTMTDACVLSTAFDAANRDFRVIVPRDIVAGYDEEAEHGSLMVVSLHLGLVVDAPALLAEWFARAGQTLPAELHGVTDISDVAGPIPAGVQAPTVTVVDIHTHVIPRFALDEAAGTGVFGVREEDGWLVHPEGFRYAVPDTFIDVGAKLADMDRLGIDVSVVSAAPTLFFYDQEPAAAVEFTRRVNDAIAALVAGSDRLYGLAGLPLQDPVAAAAELRRAVDELGLVGAHIGTNCGTTPLDAPALEPVFAAADELGAPLIVHPYYVGPKPGLEDFYFTNSIGNPLDTCVAAARLMHSGAFDRHADLRVVLVHAGGFMPYQLGRLDHAYSVRREPSARGAAKPSSYLGRFWFDTIAHAPPALEFLASLVGTDRLVVGTDIPFDMADPDPVASCRAAGVDPDALGETATRLFRLGGPGAA